MKLYNKFRTALYRSFSISAAVLVGLFILLDTLPMGLAHASTGELGNRSLTISSSANGTIDTDIGGTPANPGDGGNGQKTAETFSFILPSSTTVGSIDFLYCDTPLPGTTCNAPTGLDASHVASVQSQTGWTGADAFTLSSATTNEIKVARTTADSETNTSTPVTIKFGGQAADYIKNPTTDNYTFFVRITLYSDISFTTVVDQGTVASSTAQQVDVTAKVQETLNFSVTAGAPNTPGSTCTALPTGTTGLSLGDTNGVLSATQAYDAHSYFRLSTNAYHGVSVQYSGDTLNSGSHSISAIGTTAAASNPGNEQFGLAIDSSDTVGGSGYSFSQLAAVTTPTDYSQGSGTITSAGTAKFAYTTASETTPVPIATSSSIVVCDTGSVRYLGNIAYSTPAGIYTTDITYLVVPTY